MAIPPAQEIPIPAILPKSKYPIKDHNSTQSMDGRDPEEKTTPVKLRSISSAMDLTPGQVVLQKQKDILQKTEFEAVFVKNEVESWGIDWNIFNNETLPFDHPNKMYNYKKLVSCLAPFTMSRNDDQFYRLYGKLTILNGSYGMVNLNRLYDATSAYFTSLFPDSTIQNLTKNNGVQLGTKAIVTISSVDKRLYHVKTHSEGRIAHNGSPAKLVNPEELLVYRILQYLGYGSECHFFLRSAHDVYIATLDASHNGKFHLFKEAIENSHTIGATLWGHIGSIDSTHSGSDFDMVETDYQHDTVENNFIRQMSMLDILARILGLDDLFNNADNFGFVIDSKSLPTLRIIDFRVLESKDFQITDKDFGGFLVGNGHYKYSDSYKTMKFVLRDRKQDRRVATALDLFDQNPLVSVNSHIERAYQDILAFINNQRELMCKSLADHETPILIYLPIIHKNFPG
eukprot:gene10710-22361_t